MKLFHLSWLLSMVSYGLLGVLRRSGSPGSQMLTTLLVSILPAVIGSVLGVMSWKRREVNAWWVGGVLLFNLVMLAAGILHLIP